MNVVAPSASDDRVHPIGPEVDPDSAPFWTATREHRLAVQVCAHCRSHRFPPMPGCPHCGAPGGEWIEAPTVGTLYSWVRVHRSSDPAFSPDVPYVIATVELAPGCRLVARLEPGEGAIIGAEVAAMFVDHPEWTEVRFRMASSAQLVERSDG
ncbi:MAG: Zn-ribbon domain-containing OB-fold protein [Ilumatobacteraceae bacterium]|jgi:uncharacterized OB-fold protein